MQQDCSRCGRYPGLKIGGKPFGRFARTHRVDRLTLFRESRMIRLLVTLLLALPVAARAQSMPIDTALALAYFDELRRSGSADAGALWGRAVHGPMIFVDPSSGAIVASEADREGLLQRQGSLWTGKLPSSVAPANTATTLGGRRYSMVMWPVPDNRYSRMRLLMHEAFHRIQDSIGLPMNNPSNAHLATRQARVWTRLEWRALAEALLRSGDERKRALRDALTFRARRHALSPTAAEDERQLELNEGLSEYTGLVLSGLPRAALFDRVAVQLAQYEQQESFVRNFAYATGPAYALLLDASGTQWRRRLTTSSSLPALAAAAYAVAKNNPADSAALIARYAAARMIADEVVRETRRIAQEAAMRSRFLDGPILSLPVGTTFNFSFDPNGAMVLPGIGTVYATARISDDWGTLEVSSGGVLMLRGEDGKITGVVVPGPVLSGSTITGEGWKATLSPSWSSRERQEKGSYTVTKDDP